MPPHLPGPMAPRADPGGAKRCLDEGRCPPSGAAAPDEAQDVRSSPWPPRQKPNRDLPQAREHPALVLAVGAPVPCIYSFITITKAIYLFHLERTPCSGHLSLECSVAFLPPAPPWDVCASPGLFAGSCLSCVPTWAQGCLCLGPLTYSFQGALLRVPEWAPEGASASRAI